MTVDSALAKMAPAQSPIHQAIRIRCQQFLINELYCKGLFKVPIHLAIGHEAVAVGLAAASRSGDRFVLSHRNLHYHLSLGASLSDVVKEFALQDEGLAGGRYGSMNLISPDSGIAYTSSILGNNLSVAVGVALSQVVRDERSCTWVVTGDGAIEEGAFAESLLLSHSLRAPLVTIIEDNGWSLATSIIERRSPISLDLLVGAYGVRYLEADGTSIESCLAALVDARAVAVEEQLPVAVHVPLNTLGGRWVEDHASAGGQRFINYHAGPAKDIVDMAVQEVTFADVDPLTSAMAEPWAAGFIEETISGLRADLAWTTSLL